MAAYHIRVHGSIPYKSTWQHTILHLCQTMNCYNYSRKHFGAFVILIHGQYVGITGGNEFGFKHFLSGNYLQFSSWLSRAPSISSEILKDKMKCLNLLYCLVEADSTMLSFVESIFQGVIDFSKRMLSINDLRRLAVLLSRLPNRHWEKLDLSSCSIGDEGCDLLCEMLRCTHSSFKVKTVDVSHNSFSWESLNNLFNISRPWHVKEFIFSVDMFYDRETISVQNLIAANIRKTFHINQFITGFLLVTFLKKKKKMIAVYSSSGYIKCTQFDAKYMISELRHFINGIGFSPLTAISFIYQLNIEDVNTKLATISSHIDCVKICGTNCIQKVHTC